MRANTVLLFILILLSSCRKDLLHWQLVQKLETGTATDRFNRIFFINDSIGFVVGGQRFDNSTILKTTDGGQTWNYRNLAEAPKAIFGITATASGKLYAIAFDGKLLRSADTGRSWQMQQIWYLPYKDLAMFDENRGLIIGGVSFNQGYATYIRQDGYYSGFDSTGTEYNDLEMVDGHTGYMAGYGIIQKTEDSGYHWTALPVENDNFTAVHAYGPDEAWTCGYNGSIFHTADGGRSWQRMRNGNNLTKPHYHLLDILFEDALHGYAVGEQGVFLYSDDGGHHWMEYDRFTGSTLRSVVRKRDGSLLVCGDDGSLFRVYPRPL